MVSFTKLIFLWFRIGGKSPKKLSVYPVALIEPVSPDLSGIKAKAGIRTAK